MAETMRITHREKGRPFQIKTRYAMPKCTHSRLYQIFHARRKGDT